MTLNKLAYQPFSRQFSYIMFYIIPRAPSS